MNTYRAIIFFSLLTIPLTITTGLAAPKANPNTENPKARPVHADQSQIETLIAPWKHTSQWTPQQETSARAGLAKIQGLNIGMTRQEVLQVLSEEGGCSTANQRTYVYGLGPGRDGRYGLSIKVSFAFVSHDNYPGWKKRYEDIQNGTYPMILPHNQSPYYGFNSAYEKPDDVVIFLSTPTLGYITFD
jgi:hypothetical protein